ncbi:Sodium/hydrogen exchanger family-domain-containing protein [Limtongia smithiae]|uniref:Sodium/hydrogen exchanger family-domain-containing protein n=1 Tax=Limtongia smithiae TaxID=1125753 RepID=UPI0034CD7D85
MLPSALYAVSSYLAKRQSDGELDDSIDGEVNDPSQQELYSSWAIFILILLLIGSLWTSYYLQIRKIQAVHETVVSIFAGMIVGLIIRLLPGNYIQDAVSFKYSYFFNILLPPIILNCGYELHQANFFNNIGTILTFAFVGTFISAVVLGCIIYLWALLGLEGLKIPFVVALGFGATLSATDPVTILSIFNTYQVDPKLYTIIFGESILNDAVSIVMFETTQKLHGESAGFGILFKGIGIFLMTFTVSLLIGATVGVTVALLLKHSRIRLMPSLETCLIFLSAYAAYFFSNGCHMSGVVSLLFCGITLKHYAYFNMSVRSQIAVKYMFQTLAQLSENFIFIYLGLSLFTEVEFVYKPMLIIVTAFGVCVSRWAAVFPLSRLINLFYRARWRSYPRANNAELSQEYQVMLFWAGLRGAVGVALAAGLEGENKNSLHATILVIVVLTVIVFGGTTARMLELLGIATGVEQENESDDELDIEALVRFRKSHTGNGESRRPAALTLSRRRSSVDATKGYKSSDILSMTTGQSPVVDSFAFPRPSGDRWDPGSSSTTKLTVPPQSPASSAPGSIFSSSNLIPAIISRTAEDPGRWFQKLDDNVSYSFILCRQPVLTYIVPKTGASRDET